MLLSEVTMQTKEGLVVFGPVLDFCPCDCDVEGVGDGGRGFCVNGVHLFFEYEYDFM